MKALLNQKHYNTKFYDIQHVKENLFKPYSKKKSAKIKFLLILFSHHNIDNFIGYNNGTFWCFSIQELNNAFSCKGNV